MSAADVLTTLYYKYMNFDPKNPDDPDRDRCIVSKGHIGIFLAGMFADLGLVDKEELKTFNLTGSRQARKSATIRILRSELKAYLIENGIIKTE